MTRVILDHGGTIDDFIGDAILVVFGAPFRRDGDAARAVRCAWAMQQAMAGFNAESRRHGLPDLAMGIAVHAGMVVAGNVGGPDRVKYGVLGPPVNVASRIQAIAAGGQVLLSEAVVARVDGAVRVGAPRQVHAKGAPEPVTVYALDGLDGRPIPSDRLSIREPAGRPDEVSLTAV